MPKFSNEYFKKLPNKLSKNFPNIYIPKIEKIPNILKKFETQNFKKYYKKFPKIIQKIFQKYAKNFPSSPFEFFHFKKSYSMPLLSQPTRIFPFKKF